MENWSRPVTNLISDIPIQEAPPVKKGSPWSGLNRGLTATEWLALKEWKRNNPDLRYRRGHKREDGRIFLEYKPPYCGGEKWVSAETFKKIIAGTKSDKTVQRQYAWRRNKYKTDEAFREKIKSLSKAQYHGDKPKANAAKRRWWKKRYDRDPEFRKKARAKYKARTDRFGQYCTRDALRRVDKITGNKKLIRRIYKHAAIMKRSNGIKVEIDHVIPVYHGGHHHERNLQILPEAINRSKKDNPFWMSDGCYRDWRDVPRELWPEPLRPEYERLIALHPKPVHAIRTGFKGQKPINILVA